MKRAQKELLLRGKIHRYYRNVLGQEIVEWPATPARALATMIHLHDRNLERTGKELIT